MVALGGDIGHRHAVGAGVARVERADDQRRIAHGVAAEHVAQDRPVAVRGRLGAPAVALLVVAEHGPVHVLAARSLGGADGVLVRGVLPIRGEDGARRAVLEHGLDHVDRIVDLLDANGGAAEGIAGVCRGSMHLLNIRISVAVEGMVKAHVAGIARATHERADRREVACDLAVQNADTTRTLDKVGRGE